MPLISALVSMQCCTCSWPNCHLDSSIMSSLVCGCKSFNLFMRCIRLVGLIVLELGLISMLAHRLLLLDIVILILDLTFCLFLYSYILSISLRAHAVGCIAQGYPCTSLCLNPTPLSRLFRISSIWNSSNPTISRRTCFLRSSSWLSLRKR